MQKKINKMKSFLAKETKKRGFKNVVFGLSGGLDSAVVGNLCVEVFKERARGFIMPSRESNLKNTQDAVRFAQSIGLFYEVIDISDIERLFIEQMSMSGDRHDIMRIGNFCARLRMSILYDKSVQHNALVIGTSNKSELMLGYGTIYGDLACAINPLGALYKSEVFECARMINIPEYIINKKPSADLFRNQSDESDLGYPYEQIDVLLRAISQGRKEKELLAEGFEKPFVKSILKRIKQNSFKRKLPQIAKL